MRLNPKQVRFVSPVLPRGADRGGLRFVGKESNIQLVETALVVEGNLLKVSLLGLEVLFRRVMSEWSAVTIPYSRITHARQRNWPVLRLLALLLMLLSVTVCVGWVVFDFHRITMGIVVWLVLAFLGGYVTARLPGRYVIRFRDKAGRLRGVKFRIKSKQVRREFDRRLQEYRAAVRASAAGRAG